jgi:hypothetical protein
MSRDTRTLSVAGARVLAGQLRDAVARRHERAVARVGASRVCPFDLHALVPVPDTVLRLGPDDPIALAWLSEHWGRPTHCDTSPRTLPPDRRQSGDPFWRPGRMLCTLRSGRPIGRPGAPSKLRRGAGRGCVSTCVRATADRDRYRPGGRPIGGPPGGDCRLGGSAARRFGGLGAGSLD